MGFKRIVKEQVGDLKQTLKSKKAECHHDRPVYARKMCRTCYEKWLRKNNPEFYERQKKNCRDWAEKHKEHKKQHSKDYIKYRVKKDPQYHRIRNLRRYGMTIDDYDKIFKKQGNSCAICSNPPKEGKNLHVDHCHETGNVRGLLCFRCNFGLSYFSENVKIMKKAYEYLKG